MEPRAEVVIVLLGAFIVLLAGPSFLIQETSRIDSISYEYRPGNVAAIHLYDVALSNGTTFRYSKTQPGPGSLCDSSDPGPACEQPTEQGYTAIETYLDRTNTTMIDDDTIKPMEICTTTINNTHLSLGPC